MTWNDPKTWIELIGAITALVTVLSGTKLVKRRYHRKKKDEE